MSISTGLYPTLDLWNVNKITITITMCGEEKWQDPK
jgi:hypothetical protein